MLQAGETVRQLLRVATRSVPPDEWKRTPVILRATAGFRLLPPSKAQALLQQVHNVKKTSVSFIQLYFYSYMCWLKVRDVFEETAFYVPADSVGIMNGTDEGVFARALVFLSDETHLVVTVVAVHVFMHVA